MDQDDLRECFNKLGEEAADLYLSRQIPVLDAPPSPLEFYRDFVSRNSPVVIRGATDQWPALKKWTHDYLREKIGDCTVTVAVTPNGYADAIYKEKFVMPEERLMKFNQVLDIFEKKTHSNGVFYVQKQNSNFTDEFKELMSDAEPDISFATAALGKKPDAVNFWIGDERAVTSMHKDHYENLYCVVNGSKTFTLLPPTDQPFVPYGNYQAAKFKETESGSFDVVDDEEVGMIPWVSVDPMQPDYNMYPEYGKAHPVSVTINPGEMLFLPSLWFHHVQQTHCCIAVNYWYDMEYDIKYNYYKFVEGLLAKERKVS